MTLRHFPATGDFERLLDSDEAAVLLGIHKKTLQGMLTLRDAGLDEIYARDWQEP